VVDGWGRTPPQRAHPGQDTAPQLDPLSLSLPPSLPLDPSLARSLPLFLSLSPSGLGFGVEGRGRSVPPHKGRVRGRILDLQLDHDPGLVFSV